MPEPLRSPASFDNARSDPGADPIPLDLPAGSRLRVALTLMCVQAARAVLRHPLRSVLSGLGVAVGIAAVVWCVALGKAGTDQAEAQFASLGDNLVWIEAGSRNVNGVRNGTRGTTTLTLEDAEALRREIPQLTRVTPNVDGHVQIAYGNKNWNTQYRGVGPDYFAIKRWGLSEGAPMTDAEVNDSAAVCWIGQTVRNELFGGDDPIGK